MKELVPFEYFFNEEEAWKQTLVKIDSMVTVVNFWVVYLLMKILYDRS